jgi:hypothetical protein
MKIEVDIDLLLEAISGLKAFGQSAVEATVDKLNTAIRDAIGPTDEE